MIPLDDLKGWLGIRVDTYDDLLTAMEERAVEFIQNQLHWYFGQPRETTEYVNGTGTPRMFLRQPPDDGVVVLSSRSGVAATWEVVDSEDYEITGRGLYSAFESVWYRGLRNYRAVYLEGFSDPPGDIAQMVYSVCGALWNRREKDGYASEKIGDYGYTLAELEKVAGWAAVKANWKRGRL